MLNNTNLALLVLRLGVGLNLMILSGWQKLSSGPTFWHLVGGAMPSFGLAFMPYVWGFLAAFAEFFGSLFVILGAPCFRCFVFMTGFTMAVAVSAHLRMPPGPMSGWQGAGHALVFLAAFVALFISGPGKYVLKFKK